MIIIKKYEDERINDILSTLEKNMKQDDEYSYRDIKTEWDILYENIDKLVAYIDNGRKDTLYLNSNIWNVSYESLVKILNIYDLKFIGSDKITEKEEIIDISKIKSKGTNYYEFDWNVPSEDDKKVYMAIDTTITEIDMPISIMADGVGYEWNVSKEENFRSITKEEFLKKANINNIVYFYENKQNYNKLLNYPGNMQKHIDLDLYEMGDKPHNKISLKDKLNILKNKKKFEKEVKDINRYLSNFNEKTER